MPLLVEESAPRRVVVARRGRPHPREEPIHAPRPVALEAEDAARVRSCENTATATGRRT